MVLLIVLLALTGLQLSPADQFYLPLMRRSNAHLTPTPTPSTEKLLGTLVDEDGIVFQVPSSGCTQKKDFEVRVLESEPLQLLVVRIKPDFCDAVVPYGERIRYSYEELNLANGTRFIVINPRQVVTVVQRPPQR